MKTKNVFKLAAGLMVAAIATINFVNARGNGAGTFSIIKINDVRASVDCYSTDDTCQLGTTSDGRSHEVTNAENI